MKKHVLFLSVILALAACSDSAEETAAPKPPDSAEKLYSDARQLMSEKDYQDAVAAFEEVERQHPYSEWAGHAQIMAAYAHYEREKYDEAIAILERYVKLYPGEASAAYAYYLIALCYYEQISDVGRDQKMTEFSMQALRDVIRRFPESEYARDAKIKLDLTIDHLAGKEMQVGRYYLKQDDYIAAANRFRFVVENYQTTNHTAEALHRLVECYLQLGVKEEAQKYASVLGYNFPSSLWYRDSYKLMVKEGIEVAKPTETDSSWWDSIIP